MGIFDGIAGNILSAGTSLIGGILNREQQAGFNEDQKYQAARNEALQREFATSGIRWKVDDARKAGIHPLYALGANTTNFAPVALGGGVDTSLGSAVASAGQDISRAMNATRTESERSDAFTKTTQDLQLTRMGLENELLASQIAKIKQAGGNPPLPGDTFTSPQDKADGRPQLGALGRQWQTYPGASNAESAEKRYGDIGEEFAGVATFLQDLGYNISRSDLAKMIVRPFNMVPSVYRSRSQQERQR